MSWRVQADDDPAFARPDFDDSHWPLFDPHARSELYSRERRRIVWYRLHVNVNPTKAASR